MGFWLRKLGVGFVKWMFKVKHLGLVRRFGVLLEPLQHE
jgi:hypothetical protein